MTIAVQAVYENGVLKPEHPLALEDKTRVRVIIETVDPFVPAEDDPAGWRAMRRLKGIIKGAPSDLSENYDKYLYGEPPE